MIGRTNAMALAGQVENASYPNAIGSFSAARYLLKSGDYIYCSGGAVLNYKLLKIDTTDMSSTSVSLTSSFSKMLLYGDYIYGALGTTAVKYAKSDLSLTQTGTAYGGAIQGMATDGTYLYITGATTKTIRKYALTDLTTLVAESSAITTTPNGLAYDNGLLYVVSGANIYTYDTSTFTLQTTSVALGHTPTTSVQLEFDNGYLFYQNTTTSTSILYKIDIATLQTITSIDMKGDGALATISGYLINNGVIYFVGAQEATNKFILYSTCTTALASETAIKNRDKVVLTTQGIYVDTNYIYLSYVGSDSVLKIARE